MARDFVSYSSLRTHRECPRRWAYGYVEKLDRIEDEGDLAAPLVKGSWWHALRAADAIDEGRRKGSLKACPETVGYDEWKVSTDPEDPTVKDAGCVSVAVLGRMDDWWEALPDDRRRLWMEELGGLTMAQTMRELDRRWWDRWGEENADQHPLAVETWWRRMLPGTDTAIGGFVDEVYLDTKRGLVVVRDHKTASTLGTSSALDDMMESQLQLYAWGMGPQVREWGVGSGRVDAVAYDRVRVTPPKEPKLNLDGTLSKSVSDFTLESYTAWAAGPDGNGQPYPGRSKNGSGAGLYVADPEVLARLEKPEERAKWHQRTLVPVNRYVVEAHLQAAVDGAQEASRTRERHAEGLSITRNLGSACKWCPFAALCRAEMLGGKADPDNTEWDMYGLRRKTRN